MSYSRIHVRHSSVSAGLRAGLSLFALATLASCLPSEDPAEAQAPEFRAGAALSRSTLPPAGLQPGEVPQFIAITFDDNFGSEGTLWATDFYRGLSNPNGASNLGTFDGTPARTGYYHNSTYIQGSSSSWQIAADDGHEVADHTVGHLHGLNFSVATWSTQVNDCRDALSSALSTPKSEIVGFRAPFLEYNANLFSVLGAASPSFLYDTSIQGCWADEENGQNCPWPYTLDEGSDDADTVREKFGETLSGSVDPEPGLWELPVSTLIVPPDSEAANYGFPPGLRGRVAAALPNITAPSFYEESTGKIAGLDITLIVDAEMSKAEALATLKYSLDLRLQGNRAPLMYVAHTHVYASNYSSAPKIPNAADRRAIIEEFSNYALNVSSVRIRPGKDIIAWMQNPSPLGNCAPSCGGRECGSDGCGGSCGTCDAGESCNGGGQCVSECVPECSGRSCGDDGCGGSCGECDTGFSCNDANGQCESNGGGDCAGLRAWSLGTGYNELESVQHHALRFQCKPWPFTGWCGQAAYEPGVGFAWEDAWVAEGACGSCEPTCTGLECGDDGCGGSCGECDAGEACQAGQCQSTCVPSCTGLECGDDGCGGSCGECDAGEACQAGQCQSTCVPSCTGLECGDDGCGGSCGECDAGEACQAGQCQSTCVPSCTGLECGDDGCGGSCGECDAGEACQAGQCQSTCVPSCTGLECGDDGCGGSCGECDVGESCNASGSCEPAGSACSGIPQWQSAASYDAGQQAVSGGSLYTCKSWPYNGWCGLGAYQPGVGFAWQDAWSLVGPC